jgi:hypothetical protein
MLVHPFPCKGQYFHILLSRIRSTFSRKNFNQSLREHPYQKLVKTLRTRRTKLMWKKRTPVIGGEQHHRPSFYACHVDRWFFKSNIFRKGPTRNCHCCRINPFMAGGSRVCNLKIKFKQTPTSAFNRWTIQEQCHSRIHPIKLRPRISIQVLKTGYSRKQHKNKVPFSI